MMRKRGHNLEESFSDVLDGGLINDDPNGSVRQRLDRLLNSAAVHAIVITLVLLDLLLVTSLLLIDQGIITEPPDKPPDEQGSSISLDVQTDTGGSPSPRIQEVEKGLHITQISLLSLFIFKALLRILAKGSNFIYDKGQVFDSIVVLVTFSLYIALTGAIQSRTVTYCVGYLIVLRLWRFKRLYDCLVEPVRLRAEKIAVSHRKAWKHAEDQLKAAQTKLDSQQNEISILREQVSRLRRSSQTGPGAAYMPHSQQATPDIREEKVVSIHADQTSPQHRKAANGSVPGSDCHTPRGSIGSHHTSPSSRPGTPRSLSHIVMDTPETNGNRTEKGSNNFPDIVEDTHPFSVQNRDKAKAKAHTLPKSSSLDEEGGGGNRDMSSGYKSDRYRKLSESHSEEQYVFDNRGYQNTESNLTSSRRGGGGEMGTNGQGVTTPVHSSQQDLVTVEMDDETKERYIQSKSVPNLNTESEEGEEATGGKASGALPRPLVKGASESDLTKDIEMRDKNQWRRASEKLPLKGKASTNVGYLNPSFGVSMTDEEFREIQRISQVPFDCDDSSEKDGIPMTDL